MSASTKVVTSPDGSILRTHTFCKSTTITLPSLSTATPPGCVKRASIPSPSTRPDSSPEPAR
eukprot:4871702-Pyramimonas_sp.AAC.1